MQISACGAIGTMHHDVTVQACSTTLITTWIRRCTCINTSHGASQSTLNATNRTGIGRLAVMWTVMALLAQERSARLEQGSDVGAVRRVAVRAIF